MLAWVTTTPLGAPVVPEVYSSVAGSSGVMAAVRRSISAARPGRSAAPSASRSAQVRNGAAGRAGGRVAHDDVPQAGQLVQHRLPAGQLGGAVDDRDPGLAVGRHVGDLVRGQRRVEGDRHAPGVQRAQVGQHVLDPVGQHQRHPLPRLEAERGEGRRQLERPLAGLGPGQGLPRPAVPVGVGRPVPPAAGRRRQLAADRPPGGLRLHGGALVYDGHCYLRWLSRVRLLAAAAAGRG